MRNVVGVVLLAALLLSGLPSPAHAAPDACPDPTRLPPTPFRDLVSTTHRSAVICGAWYDLIEGTRADAFSPLRAVRRDQMASFMVRVLVAADVPLPSKPAQPFSDIDASAHREAIAQMAELGLVEGTADGRYRPAAKVRRGQVAAFLVRLARRLGVEAADAPDAFTDDDGSAHEDAINQAVALRLARGVGEGAYAPGRAVRREQMASFVSRLVKVLVNRGAMDARPIPAFRSSIAPIPSEMRDRMVGVSWHRGCPVGLDRLRVLQLTHWGFDARPRRGHLIIAATVATDVQRTFRRIYNRRFQIRRIRPMHTYGGRELASLRDNNTSAFDCRDVTGGTSWSEHAYGTAIDINPRQNPYIKGSVLLPSNARAWVDRSPVRRGMIVRAGPVVAAFSAIGWGWGGDYRSLKDYQHFSASGR